jgi:hypothetical protein
MTNRKVPGAPKKEAPKAIPPSSRFYTTTKENNENLSNENLENIQEVNVSALVEEVKKYPGNSPILSSHKLLNAPVNPVPKMTLPPHLRGKGGKRKTRRRHTKRRYTRKH